MPEQLLVFELKLPLVTFAQAVRAVPGLEFVGEDDESLVDDDGSASIGHYYAVFGDRAAMQETLRLWDLWERGRALPAGEIKSWERVFACLHDLRKWSAKDRISIAHSETFASLAEQLGPGETTHVEVELVFRRGGASADEARNRARRELAGAGAREIYSVRYNEFAYDALLVELPHGAVQALARREESGIAAIGDAYRIRPQSIGHGEPPDDFGVADPVALPEAPAATDPVVAVFDGYPVANHPYLAGRIVLDDPDNLERFAVGPRLHGTAMCSLVIHGDLSLPGAPVERPIYVRPFLADRHNFEGVPAEQSLPTRLLVDDIVRAVRRMKVGDAGQPASAPNVVAINISFCVHGVFFDGLASPLARCLDWLSAEYGVVFVVSAGNCLEPLEVDHFEDDAAFAAADDLTRTDAILNAVRQHQLHQVLLSPAESVNALTVGALHWDQLGAPSALGASFDPLPAGVLPSIISRIGHGINRSIKPDILAPGGKLRVTLLPTARPAAINRAGRASRFGGLLVAGPINDGIGAQTGWSGATSGATALTTRALHLVHDALEAAYGDQFTGLNSHHRALLLKTLALHRAMWPVSEEERIERIFGQGQDRHYQKKRADIARLFGFGVLDTDATASCAFSRATGWGVGSLLPDQGQSFRMPLPESLIGQREHRTLTATVCWLSPVLPGRATYRTTKLRIDEGEVGFEPMLAGLGAKLSSHQNDGRHTQRGTVLHRRWEGQRACEFDDGDEIELKVSRIGDDPEETGAAALFAVALSLEAGGDLPIYDQVLQHIDVEIRPRVRPQVRV